ncbi:MAG: UDP-N-acetylglucosamine--N-acetylmuramyl-(pentapeptide) pyrophosphoryl-undecaprenol N-acetylglucosamine transferase [Bacteroidia bacterium]|nr:UDP-N-acetylglucosamine--N-acetylmuramyl-(pentapeptide) pyrophosphoryl-undecaprenol N-acetylglucosamine transferase [Bacteroidia bacterium]MBX3106990.1 undecaprenyldiphospho-muramoylpentapeptide beta-N-acetylglucosaminyltransferase [Bacteroidota bacterium]MCB0849456.1 undecaprenyldiphospho-muramoylpentapeptide beta-N-acetylglucosaminyltransferase [Bacteroidota bacterium]MCB8929663.1 undecaprenyldiphospho-muramoylpentapeptide beta-N-acetylglucosaminyltransferase [Bacteroidia bacterium]MCW5930
MQQRKLKVIISGGGTGGHIFPALAIANAIRKLNPETDFLFVGAQGKMEMEKVPAAGYKIEGLWISGIKRELTIDNLSFPFKVLSSVSKALRIIREFKPDVAVGVGGYASGPLLYAASLKNIPCLIQEQNSYPGITNKILAKRVQKICVAYDGMEKYFPKEKILLTGNPVRENVLKIEGKRQEAFSFFRLNPDKKTILVVGGSQGARSINRSILAGLNEIRQADVQVVWQTGKLFYDEAQNAVSSAGMENVRVFDFISQMDFAYAAADLIVSRAGASTVSEILLVGKPSVMVPLPTAAEDHQTKNIEAMVRKNAALMVRDADASAQLVATALATLSNEQLLKSLAANAAAQALPNSAEKIAGEVIALASEKIYGKTVNDKSSMPA